MLDVNKAIIFNFSKRQNTDLRLLSDPNKRPYGQY